MRIILFSLLFLAANFNAGAQSLSDSVEFRKAFLKVFNARMKNFQTIAPGSSGYSPKVELPGDAECSLEPFYGGIGDSNFVYEALYYHDDQAQAAKAFRELLQLVRLSMTPFVLKEKEEVNGADRLVFFFQTEKEFYYDSYLEAEMEVDAKDKEFKVHLRIYARELREVYYTDKGPQDPDEAYKRVIRKAVFSSWAEFIQLKGKKTADGWAVRDSIPNYRGMITESGTKSEPFSTFELYSAFESPDEKQALAFFDKLMLKVKSAFPAGYAYYRHPEPPAEQILKMFVIQKAYEEVNTFPLNPPVSYTLSKDPERPGVYFVSFQVTRYK